MKPQYKNIPIIIGSFKSAVSKIIHRENHLFQWQRLFYDHIAGNSHGNSLQQKIMDYIRSNPVEWEINQYDENDRLGKNF